MTTSWIVRRLAAGIACLAVLWVAGCAGGATSETRIAGRPVVYQSLAGKKPSMKVVYQDTAIFEVGQLTFTIDRMKVTWGEHQALALPGDWKRIELIGRGTYVEVYVDGASLGEIRPGA
jgi:hypothetical protein